MGIPHEEAAKKVHPSARNFYPVRKSRFSKVVCGWVFEVDKDYGSLPGYTWVTSDLDVSSDITSHHTAERNVRVFSRISKRNKSSVVFQTGDAIASGGGFANTGISIPEQRERDGS